jgi:hypothetical protein
VVAAMQFTRITVFINPLIDPDKAGFLIVLKVETRFTKTGIIITT